MIDPAYLPGLATHLVTKSGDATACGMSTTDFSKQGWRERTTRIADPLKVTCLRCRRTMLYRQLRKEGVDKSDNPA